MKKSLLTIVCIFVFLFLAVQSKASTLVAVPHTISITKNNVTLGDIFSGLDQFQDIIVTTAPLAGQRRFLDVEYVMQLANIYDIKVQKPLFDQIIIEKPSQKITKEHIMALFEERLAEHLFGDSEIILDLTNLNYDVDISSAKPVIIHDLQYYTSTNRFIAIIGLGVDTENKKYVRLSGKIEERVEIYVPKHPIGKGTILSNDDFIAKKIPAQKLMSHIVVDRSELVGMITKRTLRPNQMVRTRDIAKPKWIRKGESILVHFQSGAMDLTLKAVALQDGVKNQLIRIQNPKSNTVIFAEIVRPGEAVIKF